MNKLTNSFKNIARVLGEYDFRQALPNIRKNGIGVFLKNAFDVLGTDLGEFAHLKIPVPSDTHVPVVWEAEYQALRRFIDECITKFESRSSKNSDASLGKVRAIAFYLPQFHPIPENDLWWGKGFTEWRNVAKARQNFAGHYQPRLPGDLGFYDLRLEEIMEQQAELARGNGIHGFCYYYYWFDGKRLLEMPIERMLKTNSPDFPFCLCWANENWTRRWDGHENEILMKQTFSKENERKLIKDIIRYMRNPNYIRINEKPLLLVYRVGIFPNPKKMTESWREIFCKEGVGEVYLAMAETFDQANVETNPADYGFDATVEFPPHGLRAKGAIFKPRKMLNPEFNGNVFDYRKFALSYMNRKMPAYTLFRTIVPSWDNTARKKNNSDILVYSTPGSYRAWLEFVVDQTLERYSGDERIIFINAWNEWAEGAYLEPDLRFGQGYLEATCKVLRSCLQEGRGRRESRM